MAINSTWNDWNNPKKTEEKGYTHLSNLELGFRSENVRKNTARDEREATVENNGNSDPPWKESKAYIGRGANERHAQTPMSS